MAKLQRRAVMDKLSSSEPNQAYLTKHALFATHKRRTRGYMYYLNANNNTIMH